MTAKFAWKLSVGIALCALAPYRGFAAEKADKPTASKSLGPQEIIVTAQRKSENIRTVPIPVTVIKGEDLASSNQVRLQDYYTTVPGLSMIAGSSSSTNQAVSIRGIASSVSSNPTVGYTIDDVPYGSATALGYGNVVPDIDPGDLARVEVLRGPQGTLYGASSMGGLIKFVTVDPSTKEFSGRVQAGVSGVSNGDAPGYNFRGSVNVPVSDTLAIRASAFTRKDPGYINNPVLHIDGVNDQRVSGGRVAGLWAPSDVISLKVSALYQHFGADGANDVTPGLGDLQQNYIRGTGQSGGAIQAYSGTLTAKLGSVHITSLTGYNVRQGHITIDEACCFASLAYQQFGVNGAGLTNHNDTQRFTQELRFSGTFGDRIDWLLGGIYSREHSKVSQAIPAIDPATGKTVAIGYFSVFPSTYKEYAAFGDLTFHVTNQLDVQLGLRQSKIKQTFQMSTFDPLFTGGSTVTTVGPTERSSGHPLTYLLTPRYKVSDNFMIYARFASGYRPGGPNGTLCAQFNFPCQYEADKTRDYEVGLKADFLDHRLSVDGSLYYIDWSSIEVGAVDPKSSMSYDTNAGHAKSQGLELSVQARPTAGLTIAIQGTYDDAVLTEAFPASVTINGASGDRVPYTSRFSGSMSIDQKFPIGNVTGSLGGVVSYVGDRLGNFSASSSAPRQDLPEYVRADLHLGAEYHSWAANLFVNNVFDRRGLLEGPLETFPPANIYIQPRTVGLNISKTF